MGVSTDGLLVYGVDLGEDREVPWYDYDSDDNEQCLETWWEKLHGINSDDLWQQYADWEKIHKKEGFEHYEHNSKLIEKFEAEHPEWREALDKYYLDSKEIEKSCPVEEVIYCSYDYAMYFLAVKGHSHSASRGYPKEIKNLEVDKEALQKATDFCKKYNIKWEPKWYLASLWG